MPDPKVPLTFRIFRNDQLIREERLSRRVIKIGKASSSDLKLDDATVSRMHAYIEVNDLGAVRIIDLGSSSGTRINGQSITTTTLRSGDMIRVGETRIEFSMTPALEGVK